jgi:hypothetical protein
VENEDSSTNEGRVGGVHFGIRLHRGGGAARIIIFYYAIVAILFSSRRGGEAIPAILLPCFSSVLRPLLKLPIYLKLSHPTTHNTTSKVRLQWRAMASGAGMAAGGLLRFSVISFQHNDTDFSWRRGDMRLIAPRGGVFFDRGTIEYCIPRLVARFTLGEKRSQIA